MQNVLTFFIGFREYWSTPRIDRKAIIFLFYITDPTEGLFSDVKLFATLHFLCCF